MTHKAVLWYPPPLVKPSSYATATKNIMQTRNFLESVPLGVCIVRRDDEHLRVVFANHPFVYFLKNRAFAHPFDLEGCPLGDIWPEASRDELIRKLSGPKPAREIILAVDADEGRWAKIAVAEDVYNEQSVLSLWVTDISAVKELEERLKREVAEADAIAQTKSNFLATMSHEIRTPMQAIYGFLELIGEENPPETIARMVDTAKKSASGLLEILDDILDFIKMDARQMDLDAFEVPVRTLVRGTIEALAVKVHGKDVHLIDDIGDDVPAVIGGDPKRLRQIIMNLTGNALKFTERGSVTVHVTTAAKKLSPPPGGLVLRFEIRDTGIGMDDSVCRRLFQPFSQADNSTSRKYGGTGLGLSICKKLVELMDGVIGVDSTPGAGSVFWFEVPTREISPENAPADLPALDGLSVLSVEDHPQGAREIVKSLQSMGAVVESCASCAEALALIARRPFDVAIIDQGLPDGLGLDLIRTIMDQRPYMGLIMYTVRDDIGLQHSLQALGVAYLAKPASRLGLGTAVKDAAGATQRLRSDAPARLLVAEDNPTVREVLQRQLMRLGVAADFVENGHAALQALADQSYGILFTDLHMPDMDGYALIRTIRDRESRNQQPPLPVIVLTADVQMAQRQTYLAQGFDECLLKPVSLGQLRRLLIRWGLLRDDSTPPSPSPSPPDDNAVIDIDLLMEQIGGDRDEAIEMLRLFVGMSAPLIDELTQAHANADTDALREAAHSLKGAARSACCPALSALATQLQDDAEQGKNPDSLTRDIAQAFAAVRDAVARL